MKKIRLLCIAVALIIGISAFTGCGKDQIPDTENDLIIKVFDAGYGTEFLYKLKEEFLKHRENVNIHIIPSITLTQNEMEIDLKAGPRYNSVDLLFGGAINFNKFVALGSEMLKGFDSVIEDLSDVYNSPAYGESILIKDKIKPEFYDYFTFSDGKQYVVPWAEGINGLVYHKDMFEENGWEVPKTTNDLIALIPQIKAKGYVPFTYPGTIGYWQYLTNVWWAQYEGLETYQSFWRMKDSEGNYSVNTFKQNGRLESMKVLESLIGDVLNSYEGSISFNHTEAQTKFLNKDHYKIAMMPNGDWLEGEMKKNFPEGSVNITMMKTPVISSIVNKLNTVKTEGKLKEVIDIIDNGGTSADDVSASDFERIKQARQMMYSSGFEHTALIPSYSNAKELAKDFLRFMYSDIGLEIYFNATKSVLPFRSDILETTTQNATTFKRSIYDIQKEGVIAISRIYYYDPLFYLAGMDQYSIYAPEGVIGAIGKDKKTAVKFISDEWTFITERFETYKTNAGIKD